MLTLKFDTDNAAFEDNGFDEFADIFKGVVYALASGCCNGNIKDSNGNTIGNWELTE